MSPADNTPDFDSMSPEELMAWMETLAERQGASEGFTTSKRVEIAEVDPTTVEDTGPGYIPYGMTEEQWAKKQAEEEERKRAARAARGTGPLPAAPPPAPPPAPQVEPEPAFELPAFEVDQEQPTEQISTTVGEAAPTDGMSWLESLAADQGGAFPQMDLSGLGADVAPIDLSSLEEVSVPGLDVTDPMQWLESLAQDQSPAIDIPTSAPAASPRPEPAAAIPDPTQGGVDPMAWLESLAKRQGADAEEFTTAADLDLPPAPAPAASEAPGYTDYTYEGDTVGAAVAMPSLDDLDDIDDMDLDDPDDPAAWLDSLALSRSAEDVERPPAEAAPDAIVQEALQDEVMQKLTQARDVSADEMKSWMDNLLEQGATRSDAASPFARVPEEEVEEEEEGPIQAQIPDWLVEQVGPPPDLTVLGQPPRPPEQPPLVEAIVEPQQVDDIPDWLKDNMDDQSGGDLDIFAPTEEPAPVLAEVPPLSTPAGEIEIDTSDPWVEAFELERMHGDLENIPELLGAAGAAAPAPSSAASALQTASFAPEEDLAAGELQQLPAWLSEAVPAPALEGLVVESEALSTEELPDWLREQVGTETESELAVVSGVDDEDLPEWLREAGVGKTDTVPDWLIDTVEESVPTAAQKPAPTVVAPLPPKLTPPPVRVPAVAASPAPPVLSQIDAPAVLESARNKISSGDLYNALDDYEEVVRSNSLLDAVVGDLAGLLRQEGYKNIPAVYRVLGDGLMRQGRLQDALDTYRKALNLL